VLDSGYQLKASKVQNVLTYPKNTITARQAPLNLHNDGAIQISFVFDYLNGIPVNIN